MVKNFVRGSVGAWIATAVIGSGAPDAYAQHGLEWDIWFGAKGSQDLRDFGYSGQVHDAKVFDGKLYIAGNFGTTFARFANLGKTAQSPSSERVRGILSFHTTDGFNYIGDPATNGVDIDGDFDIHANVTVFALEVFDRGDGEELVVAGDFGWVDEFAVDGISAWDGTDWSAFPAPPPLTRGTDPRYISRLLTVFNPDTNEDTLVASVFYESDPSLGEVVEIWQYLPSTSQWRRIAEPMIGDPRDLIVFADNLLMADGSFFEVVKGDDVVGFSLRDPITDPLWLFTPVIRIELVGVSSNNWMPNFGARSDGCSQPVISGPKNGWQFAEFDGDLYLSIETPEIDDDPCNPDIAKTGSLMKLVSTTGWVWLDVRDYGYDEVKDEGTLALLVSTLLGEPMLFAANGNEVYSGLGDTMFSVFDGDEWFHPSDSLQLQTQSNNGVAPALVVEYDGFIYVFGNARYRITDLIGAGGGFDSLSEPRYFPKSSLARFGPACRGDLTGSSGENDRTYGIPNRIVDADDYFVFLQYFAAGDPIADITGSTDDSSPFYGVPDGSVDADDFFYFLEVYALGCP